MIKMLYLHILPADSTENWNVFCKLIVLDNFKISKKSKESVLRYIKNTGSVWNFVKCIYYRHPPWEDNGSIYIPTILSKRYLICLAKGSFPGKRVFLGGLYLRENGTWKAFGASVLNKFEFLTKLHLKKSRWEDNGSIYTTVILPGRITVVYIYYRYPPWEDNGSIYIPTILTKRYLICLAKGSFPGKRVFLGACICKKTGAWKAFGASVLNKFEFLTKLHLKKIAMGG